MSHYAIDMSRKAMKSLDGYANKQKISREEALRRAFSLLFLADQEIKKGNTLGIVRQENNEFKVVSRIEGL